MSYRILWSPTARRALAQGLPEAVAAAAFAFARGPLAANPHRVGKRLRPPLDDRFSARRGEYRVLYLIDDESGTVSVLTVERRRDAYRTH